jgi:hypothetical protein
MIADEGRTLRSHDDVEATEMGPGEPPAILALRELVRLKDEKDQKGETAFYRSRKDEAWAQARRVLRDHDAAR